MLKTLHLPNAKSIVLLVIFVLSMADLFAQENSRLDLKTGDTKAAFVQNNGQWPEEVLYFTQVSGMNAWITQSGVVYDFYKVKNASITKNNYDFISDEKPIEWDGHVLSVDFLNPQNVDPRPGEKLKGYYNYFLGTEQSKWVSHAKHFEDVVIGEVYDEIDVKYYFDKGFLRFDYIIKPGGNPSDIKFEIKGSDNFYINAAKELEIETSIGSVKHKELFIYQKYEEKIQPIQGGFSINDEVVSLSISSYDLNKELIVDPLIWSTFLGGSEFDFPTAVAVDNNDEVLVTGYTRSADFPTSFGAYDEIFNPFIGQYDIFITKFDSDGSNLIFSTYLGGNQSELNPKITLDNSNNIFITGATVSNNFPTTTGAYDESHNGQYDAFVAKLNNHGSELILSSFLGGVDVDFPTSISVDNQGRIYVAGDTKSLDFPNTPGVHNVIHNGLRDVFITKLNTEGSAVLYSTFLGGSSEDFGASMLVDDQGNIIVSGQTNSLNFPSTSGAFDQTFNGSYDVFVTKLNNNASNLLFSTFIGGSGYEIGKGLAVDNNNALYITGNVIGNDFPTTPGVYDQTYNGSSDVFVTKLNQNGTSLHYSTYLGSSGTDQATSLMVDDGFNVFIVGFVQANDFPLSGNALDVLFEGNSEGFISQLNFDGSVLAYSSFIGGANNDYISNITFDQSYNLVFCGSTLSNDFMNSIGSYSSSKFGMWDAFVSKMYNPNPVMLDCSDLNVYLGANGMANIEAEEIALVSGNICGNISYSVNVDLNFSCPDIGNIPLEVTAYDECGNGSFCEAELQISDSLAPVLQCPGDLNIELGPGECGRNLWYEAPFLEDNCDPNPTIVRTEGPENGSEFTIYDSPYTISYEASDLYGNISTCTYQISILEYPTPISTIACNDHIILSLDQDCKVDVSADIILEGGPYACYDKYEVTIEGIQGNTVYAPGEYSVGVYDENGNNCWSTITVQDKIPPSVDCQDIYIQCYDEVPVIEPVVTENCVIYELDYFDVYDEHWCEDEFQRIILRNWTVIDDAGMTAQCVQRIFVFRASIPDFPFPLNWDGLPSNNPMLECSDNFELDHNGNPAPHVTGLPEGLSLQCNTIEYTYQDVNFVSDCGPKILRKWYLINDCLGEIVTQTQIIRITDSSAPEVEIESGIQNAVTSGWDCTAEFEVPAPLKLLDACDDSPEYTITSSSGQVSLDEHTGTWVVSLLPIGVHTITYIATDWCNNQVELNLIVNVYDSTPPIPVCEQHKQLSLIFSENGQGKIFAEDFDAGSHDLACGKVWFKVLRNDQNCSEFNADAPGEESWYDDFAVYCCEDVLNGPVFTTLRVFDVDPGPGPVNPNRTENGGDLYGHFNDCSTTVEVEEKVPPQIYCEDKVLSCEENIDPSENEDLGEPIIISTCGNYELDYQDDLSQMGMCGTGSILRTWKVLIDGEERNSCIQHIQIDDFTPFDPLSIEFPYTSSSSCLIDPFDNEPTWTDNPCNIIEAEIVNIDTFKFVENACYKILRDWVVLDWCLYEPNTGAELNIDEFIYFNNDSKARINEGGEWKMDGYYRFTEVIMVYDQIPANIIAQDVCIATETCITLPETHIIEVASSEEDEDCGGNYSWQYVLTDMSDWSVVQYSWNNAGFIGNNYQGGVQGKPLKDKLQGKEGSFTILPSLQEGQYRVTWTLNDGCGNLTQSYQYLEVADKKAPTPFIVDLATALMTNGMTEISARFFDKGACNDNCLASFDNCSDVIYFTFTNQLPLIDNDWFLDTYGLYYFDPLTGLESNRDSYLITDAHAWDPVLNTSLKVFNCNQPLVLEVDVYVWDKFSLNDSCNDGNFDFATATLNINDNGDCVGGAIIAGRVNSLSDNEGIDKVKMTVDHETLAEYPHFEYTQNGEYSFSVNQGQYSLTPSKRDDYLNGVSTLDLVLIQKHLLGLKPLLGNNLLAADANKSNSVSAADLLELRYLILGINEELPENDSWNFIPETFTILAESDNLDLDFGGIKIGDVNGSAKTNLDDSNLQTRNQKALFFETEQQLLGPGEIQVAFKASDFKEIYGFQFTLNIGNLGLLNIESGSLKIEKNNYAQHDKGFITFSWNHPKGISLLDGSILFTLKLKSQVKGKLKEMIKLNSAITHAEIYSTQDLLEHDLKIRYTGEDIHCFELYQNEPNPFTETTKIPFSLPQDGAFDLMVMDLTGKVIKHFKNQGKQGLNIFEIKNDELPAGVLYYQLGADEQRATKKMILIK